MDLFTLLKVKALELLGTTYFQLLTCCIIWQVLLFMVYLVYSVIAPLVSFVLAFCFVLRGALFRHQFIYVYPPKRDSGGRIWMEFIRILTVCLLIAELTGKRPLYLRMPFTEY